MPTETRTYVGETGTQAFSGMAGFIIGQQYPLTFERRDDGTVAIVLNHHPYVSPGAGPLVLTSAQFEKWFIK